MQNIDDFSDERQKSWCIHCAASIRSAKTNWDHVPTKGLLNRPLPPHLPQIEVCKQCNSSFSLDEEYFVTFLSCVLSGSAVPADQLDPRIQRALTRNPKLAARLNAAKHTSTEGDGKEKITWQPEYQRIQRIVLKNARGHAFFEFGEPMLQDPDHVWALPLTSLASSQRSEFEDVAASIWPEAGSRMMTRIAEGVDLNEGWVIVQDDVYRYAVVQKNGLLVRSVIRNYLATEVCWN